MKTNISQLRLLNRSKETGQALVLIALLMIILLGMLGLAIDGGGMFLLWRDAQNAVDAAALQAAFAYCTNGEDLISAQEAGYTATDMNGFDNNLVDNWVTVDRAVNVVAASELPSNAAVKNDIILVRIVAEKPSYFIQLLYGGPLKVTVTALGVCNAGGETFFEGYGVYAMGNCPGNYIEADFTGSSAHYFSNIGSNGDIRANGGQDQIIFHETNGDLAEIDWVDSINDLDKFQTDPAGSTVPGSDEAQQEKAYEEYPTLFTWDEFDIGGEAWNDVDMLNGTAGDWQTDPNLHYVNGDFTFDGTYEGLWVVDGDVSYTGDFVVGAQGVTVVATGKIGAQGNVNNKNNPTLWKPFSASEYTSSLLFFTVYAPDGIPPADCAPASHGQAGFELSGSGLVGQGLIYAPYSPVVFSGSSSFWCGSIISLTYSSAGSDRWFFTEEVPSDTALRNAADITGQQDDLDWFLDTDFMPEGTSCDYVPESQSEVFLGDLPS